MEYNDNYEIKSWNDVKRILEKYRLLDECEREHNMYEHTLCALLLKIDAYTKVINREIKNNKKLSPAEKEELTYLIDFINKNASEIEKMMG